MKVYTYSAARRSLAAVLEEALRSGAVHIHGPDGQIFVLKPENRQGSPLDVPGVDLGIDRQETLDLIREGRRDA